jgi:putative membrane protein
MANTEWTRILHSLLATRYSPAPRGALRMQTRFSKAGRWTVVLLLAALAGLLMTSQLQAQDGGSTTVISSLSGLPAFLAYFCAALIVSVAYVFVYTRITVHDELKLIEANVPGAAIALGLSLLGFAMPVASAIAHSVNLIDCIIWSIIALVVQVLVYFLVRIPVPDLSKRIEAGELAPAIWLGLASVTGGLLSAACMTW